jgi:predicted outer membrane protein
MIKTVRTLRCLIAALGAALLLSSVGFAEDSKPLPGPATAKAAPENVPRRVIANKPVGPALQSQKNTDAFIATCLAISNGEEIELAKLAISKAKNSEVREFAEMMVKDHSDMLGKLERFGGQAGLTAAGQRPGGNAADSQPGFDLVNVRREIARQCLTSAQKMWENKKLADAEMAFVGQQCVLHQQMIDTETVLRQYVSADLQQLIDKGIETAQTHKKHAEQLIEELVHESQADSKSRE